MPINETALTILKAGAVEIRDIEAGDEPFLYASGNWGPGYISIKGLVGQKSIFKMLTKQLTRKLVEQEVLPDFVAGNVTGGMIPGYQLSEDLGNILGRPIPFVYIRDTRKKGGQKELITGIANNPEILPGMNGLVVEELVNFAQTTCNGAKVLRDAGYEATHAVTILFYDNPEAIKNLAEHNLKEVYLLTLPEVLEVAEKHQTHSQQSIEDYRTFLKNPLVWQSKRGYEPIKEGGTK